MTEPEESVKRIAEAERAKEALLKAALDYARAIEARRGPRDPPIDRRD
jgi:hypothetical protein